MYLWGSCCQAFVGGGSRNVIIIHCVLNQYGYCVAIVPPSRKKCASFISGPSEIKYLWALNFKFDILKAFVLITSKYLLFSTYILINFNLI